MGLIRSLFSVMEDADLNAAKNCLLAAHTVRHLSQEENEVITSEVKSLLMGMNEIPSLALLSCSLHEKMMLFATACMRLRLPPAMSGETWYMYGKHTTDHYPAKEVFAKASGYFLSKHNVLIDFDYENGCGPHGAKLSPG